MSEKWHSVDNPPEIPTDKAWVYHYCAYGCIRYKGDDGIVNYLVEPVMYSRYFKNPPRWEYWNEFSWRDGKPIDDGSGESVLLYWTEWPDVPYDLLGVKPPADPPVEE